MKSTYSILLLTLVLGLAGCEKDTILATSNIVGEWKLAEVKEGSGIIVGQPVVFEPVQSDKKIVFSTDGTFSANGDMCFFSSTGVGTENTGSFYESLQTIEPDNCQSAAASSGITYILDGDTLIIYYPCIEECEHKYYKL